MTDHSPSLDSLHSLGTIEFLEHDPKPTFIIDLDSPWASSDFLSDAVFYNTSLRSSTALLKAVCDKRENETLMGKANVVSRSFFKHWVIGHSAWRGHAAHSNEIDLNFSFGGAVWSHFTLRKRWRVVACLTMKTGDSANRDLSSHRREASLQRRCSEPTGIGRTDDKPNSLEPRRCAISHVLSWSQASPLGPKPNTTDNSVEVFRQDVDANVRIAKTITEGRESTIPVIPTSKATAPTWTSYAQDNLEAFVFDKTGLPLTAVYCLENIFDKQTTSASPVCIL